MKLFCMGCNHDVEARLTNGAERYPHRPDLKDIPFWHCDTCGAWVGCHHKTAKPTQPLGILATPEMFEARKQIHALIDPIWKSGHYTRGQIYGYMTKKLGRPYHTGELRTMEEARKMWQVAADLHNQWRFNSEVSFK